ncbi:MAG: arginine deiminase family protein [Gilvibacter sp.]
MNFTHHTEYLKLDSVFIKTAKDAFISQTHLSEQWEALHYLSQPDFEESLYEYQNFQELFTARGITLHNFSADPQVKIDSIYCRDASIATDFGVIICNMGKGGRSNEPQAQLESYKASGIPILGTITAPGTLEGGDVAWLNHNTLAVGHTYRTNEDGIRQLKALLEPNGVEVLVARLPHYKGANDVFHLMSILSPVDKDLAVVYSPLMPINFRNQLLQRGFRLVEVPEDEFESMGCNVLAIAPRDCIMVQGNPKTQQALIAAGCKVQAYKGAHISVLGGGGPTCLTRPLKRSL